MKRLESPEIEHKMLKLDMQIAKPKLKKLDIVDNTKAKYLGLSCS